MQTVMLKKLNFLIRKLFNGIGLIAAFTCIPISIAFAAPFDKETSDQKKMLVDIFGTKFVASSPTVRSNLLADKYLALVAESSYFLTNRQEPPKIKLEKVGEAQYRISISPEQPSSEKKNHIYWPAANVNLKLTKVAFYEESGRYTGFLQIAFAGAVQLTPRCQMSVNVHKEGVTVHLIRKKVDEMNGYYAGCEEYYPDWKEIKNQRDMDISWEFWDRSWDEKLEKTAPSYWKMN